MKFCSRFSGWIVCFREHTFPPLWKSVTSYPVEFILENINIYLYFYTFLLSCSCQHFNGTGSWNQFSQKTITHLPCTVNTTPVDALAPYVARASVAIVLTQSSTFNITVNTMPADDLVTLVTRASATIVLDLVIHFQHLSQYHGYWWPGDGSHQGISSHCIWPSHPLSTSQSIPWLLMPWLLASPGHQ